MFDKDKWWMKMIKPLEIACTITLTLGFIPILILILYLFD